MLEVDEEKSDQRATRTKVDVDEIERETGDEGEVEGTQGDRIRYIDLLKLDLSIFVGTRGKWYSA